MRRSTKTPPTHDSKRASTISSLTPRLKSMPSEQDSVPASADSVIVSSSAEVDTKEKLRDEKDSHKEKVSVPLENYQQALLTIRVGEPLGRNRGGWEERIRFEVEEGYLVFMNKCLKKFRDLDTLLRERDSRYVLVAPNPVEIYMKKARNDPQDRYIRLTENNFLSTLQHRWKLANSILTVQDIANFEFEVFLYVKNLHPSVAGSWSGPGSGPRFANGTPSSKRSLKTNESGRIGKRKKRTNADTRGSLNSGDETTEDGTGNGDELPHQSRLGVSVIDPSLDSDSIKTANDNTPVVNVRIKLNGTWVPVEMDVQALRDVLCLPSNV